MLLTVLFLLTVAFAAGFDILPLLSKSKEFFEDAVNRFSLKRWAFCVSLVDKVRTHMHETKRRRDNQIDGEAEETPLRQAVGRFSSRLSSNEELHELQGVQLAKSRANSLIPDHEEPVHHQERAYQA